MLLEPLIYVSNVKDFGFVILRDVTKISKELVQYVRIKMIWYCEKQKTLVAHNYPTDKEAPAIVHSCEHCGVTRYYGSKLRA